VRNAGDARDARDARCSRGGRISAVSRNANADTTAGDETGGDAKVYGYDGDAGDAAEF